MILKSDYPLLARTHGQPAQLTTLAKELAVYLSRFIEELYQFHAVKLQGKLNGAVGTYTDQYIAKPEINWHQFEAGFIRHLQLEPASATTQLLPYDSLINTFDSLYRLQTIAIDLCQNLWLYASLGHLSQTQVKKEVGSSVMPQKINPIYLEGAEGGFEISNSLLTMYRNKLGRSRLQRDLSDSTIRRGFGVPLGYAYLSWQSLAEALERLYPHPQYMSQELDAHWEILTSSIQTYLRLQGDDQAYQKMTHLVQGKSLNHDDFLKLIESLDITSDKKSYLSALSFSKLTKPMKQTVTNVNKKYQAYKRKYQ